MALFAYYDAPTALVRCVLADLSCNKLATVIKAATYDKAERLLMGKQNGTTGEVERGTEE